MTGRTLDAYPAQFGKLFERVLASKPAPAAVLYAPEGYLRLIVHRLVVNVDYARFQAFGDVGPLFQMVRDMKLESRAM